MLFRFTEIVRRKKELQHVPLDFQEGLAIDAIVDSGFYVGATARTEQDRNKQQAPTITFEIDHPPSF